MSMIGTLLAYFDYYRQLVFSLENMGHIFFLFVSLFLAKTYSLDWGDDFDIFNFNLFFVRYVTK